MTTPVHRGDRPAIAPDEGPTGAPGGVQKSDRVRRTAAGPEEQMAATDTMQSDQVAENGEPEPATAPEPAPEPATAPGPTTPPSQTFAAELLRAMQTAAAQNRDAVVGRFRTESSAFVEGLQNRSADEANDLRRGAEEDLGTIREWSKAEIARIKAEADVRIADRRAELERQLEQHTALAERHAEKVKARIAAFEDDVTRFFISLDSETDPTVFASAAQLMPEAPDLATTDAEARMEALRELGREDGSGVEPALETDAGSPTSGDAARSEEETPTATVDPATGVGFEADQVTGSATDVAGDVPPDPSADATWTTEPSGASGEADPVAQPGDETTATSFESAGWETAVGGEPPAWQPPAGTVDEAAWQPPAGTVDEAAWQSDAGGAAPTWTPPADGYPATEAATDDASTETAATDQPTADGEPAPAPAEAGGEGWETAALDPRLVSLGMVPDNGHMAETPEQSAWQPTDAEQAPIDHDPAARLAGLVPSSEFPATARTPDPAAATTPAAEVVPTQVVVTGLVSVASIASFKRHLARVPGVQSVGVSSGPDGEFIFKATHEPDVALRDVIPALPGFGARLMSATDGALHVTARDPEADA